MATSICWMNEKVNFILNKHYVMSSGSEMKIKYTNEGYDREEKLCKSLEKH